MVKNYHFWPLTQKFDPGYDPYDFSKVLYFLQQTDALHKITHHLPFKGHYIYTNLHSLF